MLMWAVRLPRYIAEFILNIVPAASDPYETHFGPNSKVLSAAGRAAVDQNAWTTTRETLGRLGPATIYTPNFPEAEPSNNLAPIDVLERVKEPFKTQQARCTSSEFRSRSPLAASVNSPKVRSKLRMIYCPFSAPVKMCICLLRRLIPEGRQEKSSLCMLSTTSPSEHSLVLFPIPTHNVCRKRKRVLKNNERIAKNPESPPEDVQDQGFTRPSVLILLPFRNSAMDWFRAITSHTPSPAYQVENQARFLAEYDLPPGVVDKLTAAEPGTYPADHVETFKGNVDDNFRIGVKMTRKSVRMFTEFYGCDLILASPLGLRRSIEKEKWVEDGSKSWRSLADCLILQKCRLLELNRGSRCGPDGFSHDAELGARQVCHVSSEQAT